MASRRTDDPAGGPGPDPAPGTADTHHRGHGGTAPSGRLRGAEAFRLHLTLVIGLAVCIAAFSFEVTRALGGNTLSWAYVFEWPIFAVFAVYMWWHLLHDRDGAGKERPLTPGGDGGTGASAQGGPASDDADLLAWQEYLRTMEADEARQAEDDGSD